MFYSEMACRRIRSSSAARKLPRFAGREWKINFGNLEHSARRQREQRWKMTVCSVAKFRFRSDGVIRGTSRGQGERAPRQSSATRSEPYDGRDDRIKIPMRRWRLTSIIWNSAFGYGRRPSFLTVFDTTRCAAVRFVYVRSLRRRRRFSQSAI